MATIEPLAIIDETAESGMPRRNGNRKIIALLAIIAIPGVLLLTLFALTVVLVQTPAPENNEETTAGTTSVKEGKAEPVIYFAAWVGGIMTYSPLKSEVKKIVGGWESCYGIAYDPITEKIYWSTNVERKIYRATTNGSQVETVFNASQYGGFHGVAFDWITGNLYIGTDNGYIIVCDTTATRPLTCVPLLSGQEDVAGIALDPIQGIMYWTSESWNDSSICKGDMDASGPSNIVTQLQNPGGIVIDFQVARLYWTDLSKIQSSNFDGGDVLTIVENLELSVGIALVGDKIFWGSANGQLKSSTKEGTDIRSLHNETSSIVHLTVVPDLGLPRNRRNHCQGRQCSGICVLIMSSSRCVN